MKSRLITEIEQSMMSVAEVIRKLDAGETVTLTDGVNDTEESGALHRSLLEILTTVRRRLVAMSDDTIA